MSCLLAVCLQLGVGLTYANPQDCGIWYTCGPTEPHELHLTAADWSVGAVGAAWRVDYERTGAFGADARVSNVSGAPASYVGSGTVEGGLATFVSRAGPAFVELGPWVYRATWDENVADWSGAPNRAYRGPVNATGSRISLGVIGGLGARLGPFELELSARSAENRAVTRVRWPGYPVQSDGGLQMSIIKGFVTTASVRLTL